MNPVENYLKEINMIKSTGGSVDEKSFYTPLCNLINEVGKKLKPKVFCHSEVKDTGAGNPDIGLYAQQQLQNLKQGGPLVQIPERGVVEVKSASDDSWITAEGEQVTRYWGHYGQILVTNYRDFIFIGQDENGNQVKLESFRLAESESGFWDLTTRPRKASEEKGERLTEYLRRVMLHSAIISDPEKVAWFLASYAKEAKARIESAGDLPGLAAIRRGLEGSLGMKFEGEDGEHFFQATLIQTLFYGIFSSWVLWSRNHSHKSRERFRWHEAAWNLHVPMIAALFSQIATPNKLKSLEIDQVLDWAGMVLNRVDRARFFEIFEHEHAVQYFYEPFLKAYDPELRKELGVWYTPHEIVKYQVARVDTVLREELDIEDGLADPNVFVLDPCCGTGAYLVEVLRKIHETLENKGSDALLGQQLKKAAMERVFGFEILPAPFVVAHLQLGLMLKNLNAPLSDAKNERVGVYLTNALTGWEPEKKPKDKLPFPELQEEHDAAEKVKCDVPILVILGNPPYNAFAGTSPDEEEGLIEPYKKGLRSEWGILAGSMHDLYIRFFRVAERRIVKGGKGIISYISNFSYLSEPLFVVKRELFIKEFDKLWFDCMNGDSRETGKKTPDGKPDPSVFSTEHNKAGIRVGTAINLLVRKEVRAKKPQVYFRHFWGKEKRIELLNSMKSRDFDKQYQKITPKKSNRYSLRPSNIAGHYLGWPKTTELCLVPPSNGLFEKRGGALIDIDRNSLEKRILAYFNPALDWETYTNLGYGLEKKRAEIDPRKVRESAISSEGYKQNHIVRYHIRPLDTQWAYYSNISGIWNRPRPRYWEQYWDGNAFFMTRFRSTRSPEGIPCCFVTGLSDDHFISPDNACFPILLRQKTKSKIKDCGTLKMFDHEPKENIVSNLSESSRKYLEHLDIKNPDERRETAALIWMHSLAIGYSPAYLSENKDGIRKDWPRIPLPDSKEILLTSTTLGKEIASLLDTESNVKTVTSGIVRSDLQSISVVKHVTDDSINPEAAELDMTKGWGHFGKNNVVMPGIGKIVERPYTPKEKSLIKQGADKLGFTLNQALVQLGETTCDIYLNDVAYWSNIPVNVWNYYIGGYQVIKKWLSYREKEILGRGLKMEEVHEVMNMARRIAAIILLQPALDENYQAVKKATYNWSDEKG